MCTGRERKMQKMNDMIKIPMTVALGAYSYLGWYATLIDELGAEECNLIDVDRVKECKEELYRYIMMQREKMLEEECTATQ